MKKLIFFAGLLTVCFWGKTFCQVDALTEISTKLQNYNRTFLSEKLYVHTDKNFYTAGEIIWFRIYQLDSALSKTRLSSKVAYVELLDDHNVSAVKTKIELDEKGGSGSLELPLSLNSGFYTFLAYTNWMKNFDAEYFFQKKITVVNTLKSMSVDEKLIPHGSIDLFPEGGNLVNGISSEVGFKVLDKSGKGANGYGYLLNEKNDTVLHFEPYKFGLGSFHFTPDINHNYKAIFILDDKTIVAKNIPVIYNQGYVMHVNDEGEKIRITVTTNISSDYPETVLIIQNHQLVKTAKRNVLSNGIVNFIVDKSELGAGVSQLTVFNNEKQPVCERLFFVLPSQTTIVRTTASKEFYNNREQVVLSTTSNSVIPANLSVSVFQFDSLQTKDGSDITTYFWLESELQGKIENPQYYLSANNDDVKKATDYLMLTHGWRRFDWDKTLSNRIIPKFFPETSGQVITCKVNDVKTGLPAKDVQVFLSIPETSYKLFTGTSNDSGIVKINVQDFYGKSDIILQTKESGSYKVELIDPFARPIATTESPVIFTISPGKKSLLENYGIAMQAQHIYSADSIQKIDAPDIKDTFPFFGKAPYSYKLDDYTRFTTMEEVLREYVREINVGVKGSGDLKFKLFNEDNRDLYTDNILVVLDGVPVFNTSKIFSVDPLKIRKIDVITKSYIVGNSFFYGLASFSSYNGNYEGFDIDPKAIRINYQGLQMQREFYSPDYSTEQHRNGRIPDLRTTLFWSGNIKQNQPIRFYTGDNKGKYMVLVQGLSNNNEPLSSTASFEVK
jgi:hypothetical protein